MFLSEDKRDFNSRISYVSSVYFTDIPTTVSVGILLA